MHQKLSMLLNKIKEFRIYDTFISFVTVLTTKLGRSYFFVSPRDPSFSIENLSETKNPSFEREKTKQSKTNLKFIQVIGEFVTSPVRKLPVNKYILVELNSTIKEYQNSNN